LEPILVALARWGAVYLAGTSELESRGRWLLQAMSATAGAPPSSAQTVNFVLDGEESHVRVTRGGGLAARDGLSPDAPTTVRGTVRQLSLLAAGSGRRAPAEAHFEVEGERRAAERLLDHLVAGIQQAAGRRRLQA
jgi:hypothetical protein